jgi:hypothetical protein
MIWDLFFLSGVLTLDLSLLSLYRYFLVSDVFFLLAYLGYVARHGLRARFLMLPSPLFISFWLYALSSLISMFRALDFESALYGWLHFVFLAFIYVPTIAAMLADRPNLVQRSFIGLIVVTLYRAVDILLLLPLHMIVPGARLGGLLGIWTLLIVVPGLMGMLILLYEGGKRNREPARQDSSISLPLPALGRKMQLLTLLATICVFTAILVARFRGGWLATIFSFVLLSYFYLVKALKKIAK